MDNTEYTIKKDEIRELISQKEYVQAAEIADTIDWRRVRSVMMLCTVSDLYKINRRYEDAKEMLLLAYELRPGGRGICYSLCELCIKLEEFVEAVGYYKEFVQASPKDPDRYVLQYKLYEAQDVSLEERIEVLKELKQREYREKWLYELAYLYHRIGQATLCVEECDELILWFGDGKYVYKAMELKKLHQPLTPSQQKKYDHRFDDVQEAENAAKPSQKVVYPQPAEKPRAQERGRQSAYKQPQGYDGQPAYERPQSYDRQPMHEQPQGYDRQPMHEQPQGYDEQPAYERLQGQGGRPAYEQAQSRGRQPVYEQPQGYDRRPVYEQPQGYDRQPVYEQPQGYDRQPMHEQPQGYDRQPVYEQPQGYDRQPLYEQPQGYDRQPVYEQAQDYDRQPVYEQPQGYDRKPAYEQPQDNGRQTAYDRPQMYDRQPWYEQVEDDEMLRQRSPEPELAQRVRTARPDGVSQSAVDMYERNMVSAEAAQGNAEKADIPDIQVPIMDMGQYNTMNLQAELKAGLEEVLGREEDADTDAITKSIIAPMFETDSEVLDLPDEEEFSEEESGAGEVAETEVFFGETGELNSVLQHAAAREIVPEMSGRTPERTMRGARSEMVRPAATESASAPARGIVPDMSSGAMREMTPDVGGDTKVFEIVRTRHADTKPLPGATAPKTAGEINAGRSASETGKEINAGGPKPAEGRTDSRLDVKQVADETAQLVMNQMRMENREETRAMISRLSEELARVLAQESDGQISFVLPESEKVEKQITGQLSIQDILTEWERRKQETAEKRREDLERRIQQQTGEMFTEFEAAVRDGLLEKLESETDGSESVQEQEEAGEFGGQTEEISAVVDGELSSGIETPIGSEERTEETAAEPEDGESEAVETEAVETIGDAPDEPASNSEEQPEEAAAEAEGVESKAVEAIEEMPDESASNSEEQPEYAAAASEGIETEAVETIGDAPDEPASNSEEQPEEAVAEPDSVEPEAYAESDIVEPEAVETIGDTPEEAVATPEAGEPEAVEAIAAAPDEPASNSEDQPEPETAAEPEYVEPETFEAVEEFREDEYQEAAEEMPEAEQGEEGWSDADAWEDAGDSEEFYGEEAPDTGEYVEQEEQQQEVSGETEIRPLTNEEKELYAPFIQTRAAREQLVRAIDNISLAAYTGNIVITGEEGVNTVGLAKNMIREIQASDRNFSGKVAKISGQGLNQRDVRGTLLQLKNGALIVQKASGMTIETAAEMYRTLQQDNLGLVVALEDTRKGIAKLFDTYSPLKDCFTARMDVEALSNDTLAAFGRRYAREMEYSIDELGMLALHRRIEEMQTVDHAVTVVEVKEIVDEAIRHARRKNLTHFMDVLFARRYDEEDMIILTEKDFME